MESKIQFKSSKILIIALEFFYTLLLEYMLRLFISFASLGSNYHQQVSRLTRSGGSDHCNTTNVTQLQSMIPIQEVVMRPGLASSMAPIPLHSENSLMFNEKRMPFDVRLGFKFWLYHSWFDKAVSSMRS